MKSFLFVISTALVSSSLAAKDLSLTWTIQPYSQGEAQVGDTLTFNWESDHNVYVHPSGDCTTDGAILIGEDSGASHTFTADQVGEVTFACDLYNGAHCGAGQIITYVVTDASPTVDDAANTVDEAAAPAEPTTTKVDDAAAPAESATTTADDAAAPAESATTTADDAAAPADDTAAPADPDVKDANDMFMDAEATDSKDSGAMVFGTIVSALAAAVASIAIA